MTESEKNPNANNAATASQPLRLMKSNANTEEASEDTIRTCFRPKRSLTHPLKNSPGIPDSSKMEREAPATHRLARVRSSRSAEM